MLQVNVKELRTQLRRLIAQVEAGEEVIDLDTGVLVAYYVPEALSPRAQQRIFSVSAATVSELARNADALGIAVDLLEA